MRIKILTIKVNSQMYYNDKMSINCILYVCLTYTQRLDRVRLRFKSISLVPYTILICRFF